MTSNVNPRIAKEVDACKRDPGSGVDVELDPSNNRHYIGIIKGPDGTGYAGGVFRIDITLPDDYPFAPPKMKFITKVWHPNVSSQTGAICLDILKDQWSPALTIKTALLSIQALLSSPEPNDPQDAQVANMYLSNPEQFLATARMWTENYATPGGGSQLAGPISRLVEMGFSPEAARTALINNNGDENLAVNELLASV